MQKSNLLRILLVIAVTLGILVGCSNPIEGFTAETSGTTESETAVLDEKNPLLVSALADFYTDQNDSGLVTVEDILENEPDNAMALALRAGFKLRKDDAKSALADANRAIEIDPKVAFAYVTRAWYYEVYENDLEAAKTNTELALKLDPDLAFAYTNRGSMKLFSENDPQGALDDYKRAIELEPNYLIAYIYISNIYSQMEKYDKALMAINQAISIAPESVDLYKERGNVYFYSGDYQAAEVDYTYVIEQGTADALIYANRAYINADAGDYRTAVGDYENAFALDPEDANSYNGAAYSIARSDGDLEKALTYIDKALELMPGAETKLDTKGFIYFKMGEYDQALDIFSSLLENNYTYAYFGRGLVYEALGETDPAISDFQAFVKEYPDSPESKEAQEHLDNLGG